MTPQNARVDMMSSTFGRTADFDNVSTTTEAQTSESDSVLATKTPKNENHDAIHFSPESAGAPTTEPMFGSHFWSHSISTNIIDAWVKAAEPKLPPPTSVIALPPINQFIPTEFDLKPTPPDDTHHPLLHCSLKLCVSVGKRKVGDSTATLMYFVP